MSIKYYSSERVNDHISVIRSLSGELMYLITGNERAVLLDTCIGMKGLKDLVLELTDKPLTVLISHGHIDHAMGAPEFYGVADVYMNLNDISLYQSQCAIAGRRGYAGMALGAEVEKLADDEFVPEVPEFEFCSLKHGMSFDLGGITVKALDAFGHTQGCMAFLVEEEKLLIVGDACNNSTFLFDDICYSVSDYKKSLIKLSEEVNGKYERVFIMHNVMEASTNTLSEAIEVCDDILSGNVDNMPFEFMGKTAYVAKLANERAIRFDGKFANIVYNPDNLGI